MADIKPITDFLAPELDIYSRRSEVQLLRYYEPNPGIFIAESPKVIERALHAGYEPISFLLEDKHIEGEMKHILENHPDIPAYTAPFDVLTQLTGFKLTRGALCAMKRKALVSPDTLLKDAHRIAILENVVNPTNIGAIFHSAAAMHIDAVLLTPGCSDPLYRRAARVSMGTVFQIPWTIFPSKKNQWHWNTAAIDSLHSFGFKLAALALTDDSVSIEHPALHTEEKLAILLGAEGDGLTESTIKACDYTVKIPMSHGVDSLNVAAASAVAFWELRYRD